MIKESKSIRQLRLQLMILRSYEMCSSGPGCKTDREVHLSMAVAIQLPDDAVAEPRTLDRKNC